MKKLSPNRWSIFALAWAATTCTFARDLSCRSEKRFGTDGYFQMSVILHQAGEEISRVELDSATVLLDTQTGYTCHAEFDVADKETSWLRHGRFTVVRSDTSLATIERTSKGYRVDLSKLSDSSCGHRARWPVSVFVFDKGKRCVTKYP